MLDNRETETFQKIPFISSVPILGKFFQSINRTKQNTELIVIVTPEVVNPIPVGAPLPQPNFPHPFLAPNSNIPMHNPEPAPGATQAAQAPAAIPVEKLIESLKPEKPLVIDDSYKASGGGSSSGQSAPQ